VSAITPTLADRKLLRFIVVGAGAAGLFFVLSFLLVSTGLTPFLSGALAYAAAFVAAYTLQRNWTFASRQDHGRTLPRYFLLQLGCATLSGVISHVAVARFGFSPLAMSGLATVLVSAVSYAASSLWVFRDSETR
jgi:putative flippase GtrA